LFDHEAVAVRGVVIPDNVHHRILQPPLASAEAEFLEILRPFRVLHGDVKGRRLVAAIDQITHVQDAHGRRHFAAAGLCGNLGAGEVVEHVDQPVRAGGRVFVQLVRGVFIRAKVSVADDEERRQRRSGRGRKTRHAGAGQRGGAGFQKRAAGEVWEERRCHGRDVRAWRAVEGNIGLVVGS
jgi:hypothetical protein